MKKENTVCFSGYRPDKFGFLLNENDLNYVNLINNLNAEIKELYFKGYRNFIYGGALGFDIIAAEAVVNLKSKSKSVEKSNGNNLKKEFGKNSKKEKPLFEDINLFLYKPYPEQEKSFGEEWKNRYTSLLPFCKKIKLISSGYYNGCFHKRNRQMVDDSSVLVTFYTGIAGGTKATYNYALKSGTEIINLYR